MIFVLISFLRTSSAPGVGEGGLPDFFFFFPCLADHERDWPPCKVVFFGLATNALNVRNNKLFVYFQVNNGVLYFLDYVEDIYIMVLTVLVSI